VTFARAFARSIAVTLACALCLSATARAASAGSAASAASSGAGPEFAVDDDGRRFRIRFDPATRVRLGVGEAMSVGSPTGDATIGLSPELTAGIGVQTVRSHGGGRDRVVWQIDHRLASGWIHPLRDGARPVPAFDALLYGVTVLRHDESPSLVLPSSPPVGIPFPFDIGFEAELGRATASDRFPLDRVSRALVPELQIAVLRGALLFDPWRSGEAGRSLEIGIGARYDLDVFGAPALSHPRVVHRVAPMTAASLRWRWRTDDGLFSFDARGDVVPHWTSEGVWRLAALASLRVERVVLAIDDQPLTIVLDGGWRLRPATGETERAHDVRVTLGVALDLWSR
jgi:hypothetical protein